MSQWKRGERREKRQRQAEINLEINTDDHVILLLHIERTLDGLPDQHANEHDGWTPMETLASAGVDSDLDAIDSSGW